MRWDLLEKGDTVLVHSSLRRLLRAERCKPQDVIDSLLDAVGGLGTVVFPLFNFDFCHRVPFDEQETKSHMGVLSETARLLPYSTRTRNPIYRFCAIGHYQTVFFGLDYTEALGRESVFHLLRELDAKIAVIDLPDQHSMSIIHHAECMRHASHRFSKHFTSFYTDWKGETNHRTYECYVRYENVETYVTPMQEIMQAAGVYQTSGHMRVGRARRIFDEVARVVDSGQSEGVLWIKHPPQAGMKDVLPFPLEAVEA
jgi:aminoglycoside 3-N-acetyltransferase